MTPITGTVPVDPAPYGGDWTIHPATQIRHTLEAIREARNGSAPEGSR